MPHAFYRGDGIELRPLHQTDADVVAEILNSPDYWQYDIGTEPQPQPECRVEQFVEQAPKRDDATLAVFYADGEAIGMTGIYSIDPRVRDGLVGGSVLSEYQGRGHGFRATRLITEFGFEQLNLNKLTYKVLDSNEPSVRIIENLGATREGTLRREAFIDGEYRDVGYYGLLADEWFSDEE